VTARATLAAVLGGRPPGGAAQRLARPGHRLARPGHRLARPGHRLARPGHRLARPGHRLARPGHRLARLPSLSCHICWECSGFWVVLVRYCAPRPPRSRNPPRSSAGAASRKCAHAPRVRHASLAVGLAADLRAARLSALARTISGSRGSRGRMPASARSRRCLVRWYWICFIAYLPRRACPGSARGPMRVPAVLAFGKALPGAGG
jgi:hypothetical protein